MDLARFSPDLRADMPYPRPVFLYVGRVAVEKNLRAFLSLDLPGTKLVVGGWLQREALVRDHPAAHFVGERHDVVLAQAYRRRRRVRVPVAGRHLRVGAARKPRIGHPGRGALGDWPRGILEGAAPGADALDHNLRAACRVHAERFSWRACAIAFLANLVVAGPGA